MTNLISGCLFYRRCATKLQLCFAILPTKLVYCFRSNFSVYFSQFIDTGKFCVRNGSMVWNIEQHFLWYCFWAEHLSRFLTITYFQILERNTNGNVRLVFFSRHMLFNPRHPRRNTCNIIKVRLALLAKVYCALPSFTLAKTQPSKKFQVPTGRYLGDVIHTRIYRSKSLCSVSTDFCAV